MNWGLGRRAVKIVGEEVGYETERNGVSFIAPKSLMP